MDVTKFISYQIERQFPAIYREDGPELVEFVKAYYQFLEEDIDGYYVTGYTIDANSDRKYFANKFTTYAAALSYQQSIATLEGYGGLKIVRTKPQSVFHNRRLFEYNDIDSTLEQMLLFYKNKYLNSLPFDQQSIRFVVKHILDYYRRKGSREGIELFFRLFYSENVAVYYPSQDILKPSASIWRTAQYIELFPQDPSILRNSSQLAIYGTISGATAIIDRVNYMLVGLTLIPIVYLSNVRGRFTGYDNIVSNGVIYGKVRGSLNNVTISNEDLRLGSSNNNVGDIVDIFSDAGYGSQARVSKVSSIITGEISFEIRDGGFGYTTANTDIILSDQTVYINDPDARFTLFERVAQANTNASGVVVGQRRISSSTIALGLLLSSANTFNTTTNTSTQLSTVERTLNISRDVEFAGPRNSSASAKIGDNLTNVQSISIITDLIKDFLNVPIDATNYSAPPALIPMSGNAPFGTPNININTAISNAFIFRAFEIGTLTGLKNINPGIGYVNDVFAVARENVISRFDLTNQIITFNENDGAGIEVGDILVQNNPTANTTNLDIKGLVKSRSGNFAEVMQLTFQGFNSANSMFIQGSSQPIPIISVQRDYSTNPIGLNATVEGFISSGVGKIEAVEVFDSGIGFLDGATVTMRNVTRIEKARMDLEAARNNPLSTPQFISLLEAKLAAAEAEISGVGTAVSITQGKSQGVWESTTSHLNSDKVIQDSNFYQDFSYQVVSKLNPGTYLSTLKDLAHVAGTKVFHKFSLEEEINIGLSVSSVKTLFTSATLDLISEDGSNLMTENGAQLSGVKYSRQFIEE